MRIAWSGQHTRTKALPILIKAVALIKNNFRRHGGKVDLYVDVLGVGTQTKRWKKLSKRFGVSEQFLWHGWLKREEALQIVATADIFAITSLKDLTSTVVLEALSKGKPVVCIDHCGFADVVDETCGIKVPIGVPADVIRGFANAIMRLTNKKLREILSAGALKQSLNYRWSNKIRDLEVVYGPCAKKVLMSVYACSPYRGSEPGMGWKFVEGISKRHEVWAIVEQEKWQKEIEQYLVEHSGELSNVHWTFIRKPRARILRKIWPPSYYWFYRIWQWRAYKKAKELHAAVTFDIIHQVNMVGFRECGYLWKVEGPKFVWGPIGGLGYTDWRLLPLAGLMGGFELGIRNVINFIHTHFLRRPIRAAKIAMANNALLVATKANLICAQECWGGKAKLMCEVGV